MPQPVPGDEQPHSFSLKVGKLIDARANGWGVAGLVAVAVVTVIAYLVAFAR